MPENDKPKEAKPAGQMAPSPVPPPGAAPEIELQAPAYLPGTLPIYPAKMDPAFWAPGGEASALPPPPKPDPALRVRANVDEQFKPVAGTEK